MDCQDEFVLLACDGLWDVMTSPRAVENVRLSLRRHNDPDRAARVWLDDSCRVLYYRGYPTQAESMCMARSGSL